MILDIIDKNVKNAKRVMEDYIDKVKLEKRNPKIGY